MSAAEPEAPSAAYLTWCNRIDNGVFSKGQCLQWCHAVVALAYGEIPGGKKTNLAQCEAERLIARIDAAGGVRLTDEHTAQGLQWLERYGATVLPALPADWRARFDHFRFMGDAEEVSGYGRARSEFYPVWTIVLGDDERWNYHVQAWQVRGSGDAQAWQVRKARVA